MTDIAQHIGYIDRELGKVNYTFLRDRIDPSKSRQYNLEPEEEIRFLMVVRLIEEYGYLPSQIDLEISIQAGQVTLPKRADIVVFQNNRSKDPHSNAHIICELKTRERRDGVEQLETYINNTTAEYGVWWNGDNIDYKHRSREPHKFEEIPDIPRRGETLEDIGTWDKNELKPATELIKVFDTVHNHIYANEGYLKEKAFNEMLKFIFLKTLDEKLPDSKPPFRITSRELEEVNAGDGDSFRKRISGLWQRVKKEYGDVFDEAEKINLKLTTQAFIVSQLQKYNFTRTPADIKGIAFQTFVYAHQRGERGEFFTPHPVVELMVSIMDPSEEDELLDPAVGSAGLLVRAMLHVWDKIEKAKHLNELERKDRKYTFARYYVRGIDINPDLAKVAKMHMVVYDDGHTGIFCEDSLADFDSLHEAAVQMGAIPGKETLEGGFRALLTNPPFGTKGKVTDKNILLQYDLGHKWKLDKKLSRWIKSDALLPGQTPEILFIERCLQFLRIGGKMAIVLPDGILTNSSLGYVRQWIIDNAKLIASVSLPPETFIPYGSGPKASILFLQKLPTEEIKELNKVGYTIFFASAKKVGYNVSGREMYLRDETGQVLNDDNGNPLLDTDFPKIAEAFQNFSA
jgi:type I restriction enzyme M protein